MTLIDIGLLGIIAALLIERFWDKRQSHAMQDMLNRALIAKSVPEYEMTAKAELKKAKLENENALEAAKLLEKYAAEQTDEGIPLT